MEGGGEITKLRRPDDFVKNNGFSGSDADKNSGKYFSAETVTGSTVSSRRPQRIFERVIAGARLSEHPDGGIFPRVDFVIYRNRRDFTAQGMDSTIKTSYNNWF